MGCEASKLPIWRRPRAQSLGQHGRERVPTAQSATEFFMTYGWAVLIVAVVLAALFELGIFNHGFGASTCIPIPSFTCRNPVYGANTITFDLGQNTGHDYYGNWVFVAAQGEPLSANGIPINFTIGTPPSYATQIGSGQDHVLIPGQITNVTFSYFPQGQILPGIPAGTNFAGYVWLGYCLSAPCTAPTSYEKVATMTLVSVGGALLQSGAGTPGSASDPFPYPNGWAGSGYYDNIHGNPSGYILYISSQSQFNSCASGCVAYPPSTTTTTSSSTSSSSTSSSTTSSSTSSTTSSTSTTTSSSTTTSTTSTSTTSSSTTTCSGNCSPPPQSSISLYVSPPGNGATSTTEPAGTPVTLYADANWYVSGYIDIYDLTDVCYPNLNYCQAAPILVTQCNPGGYTCQATVSSSNYPAGTEYDFQAYVNSNSCSGATACSNNAYVTWTSTTTTTTISWSVSLSASSTTPSVGQAVTLTATTNHTPSSGGYYLRIFDLTNGTTVCQEFSTTTCSVSVSESQSTSQTYEAAIDPTEGATCGNGNGGIACSNQVSVNWEYEVTFYASGLPQSTPQWCVTVYSSNPASSAYPSSTGCGSGSTGFVSFNNLVGSLSYQYSGGNGMNNYCAGGPSIPSGSFSETCQYYSVDILSSPGNGGSTLVQSGTVYNTPYGSSPLGSNPYYVTSGSSLFLQATPYSGCSFNHWGTTGGIVFDPSGSSSSNPTSVDVYGSGDVTAYWNMNWLFGYYC